MQKYFHEDKIAQFPAQSKKTRFIGTEMTSTEFAGFLIFPVRHSEGILRSLQR